MKLDYKLIGVPVCIAMLLILIAYEILGSLSLALLVVIVGSLGLAASVYLYLLFAKSWAITADRPSKLLFFGLVELVLWKPNEGFILLRNMKIREVVRGTGGGVRFIFPIFGEKVVARVPFGMQLTHFADNHILTRESVQVRVKVAMWWHVADLEKYFYRITPGVHLVTEGAGHSHEDRAQYSQRDTAEAWLQALAESSLRKLISQANTAILVSANASGYLNVDPGTDGNRTSPSPSPDSDIITPSLISEQMRLDLSPKIEQYGLELNRIEIQDIALSPEIQQAITRVWTASLLPAQSEAEAKAKQIELQAVANVLGVDAAGLNEVAKNFKNSNFIGGLPNLFESLMPRRTNEQARIPSEANADRQATPTKIGS